MRSFSPKIVALALALTAVPFAGAYAGPDSALDNPDAAAPVLHASKHRAALDQLGSVEQGIADARENRQITPMQEHRMIARADMIRRDASHEGSRRLLRQIDRLDNRLSDASGQHVYIGSGDPNG